VSLLPDTSSKTWSALTLATCYHPANQELTAAVFLAVLINPRSEQTILKLSLDRSGNLG
jgi:hypothetical protein